MGRYISLGEYNKFYNYIWSYTAIKFISSVLFYVFNLIRHILISLQFKYIAFIIISIIILLINNCRKKKVSNTDMNEEKLIFNKHDTSQEFGVSQKDYFLFINLFFVILLDLFEDIIYLFNCSMFDFWMFEMLFFELMNSKFFKTKIYKHHIYSFVFILSFCSIINVISLIIIFSNDTNESIFFEDKKWLIPVAIIIYFLYHIFRAYTYCNEKYYLEKRVISITNYLLIYGIFGFIASSICAIVSSFVPCGDDNNMTEFSQIICIYKDNNGKYYFCNYSLYIKELSSKKLSLRVTIGIIYMILNYVGTYNIYVIYKKLNPIYYICAKRLDGLFISVFLTIFILGQIDNIPDLWITLSVLEIINFLLYIIGSIVYLEFIELNFYNLNYYTKKNIRERAKTEITVR